MAVFVLLSAAIQLLLCCAATAEPIRLNSNDVGLISATYPSCVMGSFTANNRTNRMYDDAFLVGDYTRYRHLDHVEWVHSWLSCSMAFENANENETNDIYRGKFCIGQAKDKMVGACLNERCNVENKTKILVNLATHFSKTTPNHASKKVELESPMCVETKWKTPWYKKVLPLSQLLFEVVMFTILISSTIYEVLLKQRHVNGLLKKIFLCFSLKTNLVKLASIPSDPHVTIACISGLRVLSMIWTTLGHSYMVLVPFVSDIHGHVEYLRNGFFSQIVTNFTLCTDLFFVLSGTLAAYGWFRKVQKTPKEKQMGVGYWLRYYRHRVIRLWPAYVVAMFAAYARYSYTHMHPLWPPVALIQQCNRYWWQNLLFLNSLFPNRCMPWLWYLGTDFIFYLLSPIFLMSIYLRPKTGVLLTTAVILLSIVLRVIIIITYNFPPTQFLWFPSEGLNPDFTAHHLIIYTKPYTRIGTYLVGILLGYLLNVDSIHIDRLFSKENTGARMLRVVCWMTSSVVIFWTIFGIYPATQGWGGGNDLLWTTYNRAFGAVHRVFFAIALSWLIFACHKGFGRVVNAVLGSRLLVPLANLSYSAYLFHVVPLLALYLNWRPFPMQWHGHIYHLAVCFALQLVVCYASGLSLTLIAELPAINIEKLLLFSRPTNAATSPYCRPQAVTDVDEEETKTAISLDMIADDRNN